MPRKTIPGTVHVVEIDSRCGSCSMHGPRAIWINAELTDWEQFATLHHEWLHRWLPDLTEHTVLRLEADFVQVVKKFFVVKRRKARKRRKKA